MTAKRLTLTQTRIADGVWEGVLTGAVGAGPLRHRIWAARWRG
jgi:hypothetical protein